MFRRRLDGSFAVPEPLVGVDGSRTSRVAARGGDALAVGSRRAAPFSAPEKGPWRERPPAASATASRRNAPRQGEVAARLGPAGQARLVACYTGAVYLTTADTGATWTRSPGSPPFGFSEFIQLAAAGDTLYFLCTPPGVSRSTDWRCQLAGPPAAWSSRPAWRSIPIRPQGLLVVSAEGRLARYFFGPGIPRRRRRACRRASARASGVAAIANSPAFPHLVYGLRRGLLSRSLDFGITWTPDRPS